MTETINTNLDVLSPTRRQPGVGDIFALRLAGGDFRFGRVIRTDAKIGPMEGVILIYVYSITAPTAREPEPQVLTPDRLLVAPMMTNRQPWLRGYFQTVGSQPLSDSDLLGRHCFLRAADGCYYDEYDNKLDGPVQPVGERALQSFRTIDDELSDAVGLPRVPA